MLATAICNCSVTNVTNNENKYYVVTWTVYLESSMYLGRRQIVVMCHITCWFRSGAGAVVWPVLSLRLLNLKQAQTCFLVNVGLRMRKWLIHATWFCEALDSLQIDIARPPTKLPWVRYWLWMLASVSFFQKLCQWRRHFRSIALSQRKDPVASCHWEWYDMMLLLQALTSFLCANFGLQVAASHAATPRIALPARTKVSVECMAAEQERSR